MKGFKCVVIKLKHAILPFLFCTFLICLIVFSKTNLDSTKAGLQLWANNVVPTLLPFFIATELLSHTCVVSIVGKLLSKIMRPVFHVPGEGAFPLIMGIISGYPTGAKIVANFRKEGICTKEEGERLIAFTNNSGPLFIIGTVGISLFGDLRTGILLFITHVLATLSVGICFRFWKNNQTANYYKNSSKKILYNQNIKFSSLGEALANSIMNSIHTILLIGGFIVIFSVIIAILKQSQLLKLVSLPLVALFKLIGIKESFASAFISGLLELTNGVSEISIIHSKILSQNILFCSFLLGFGGISVLLQVFSVISKSDISIKSYFYGKMLQACFATFYTYILLNITDFFNLDIVQMSLQISLQNNSFSSLGLLILVVLLFTFLVYNFKKLINSK